jgi:hypothetical protein
MIDKHSPEVPRHKPASGSVRRLRNTFVVAMLLGGIAAAGTTAGFARDTSQPQPTPQTNQYVLPSKQVMREMRQVIIALYGPRPPAGTSVEPQRSPPADGSRRSTPQPHAG